MLLEVLLRPRTGVGFPWTIGNRHHYSCSTLCCEKHDTGLQAVVKLVQEWCATTLSAFDKN